jgi:phosphopantothenoylcysteine synthetase/decarboxylase
MWAHPATQRNAAQLVADGAFVLPVGQGDQACGETGDGRMLEPEELLQELVAHFQPKVLRGQHVLVTAGPTFEAMDPVNQQVAWSMLAGTTGIRFIARTCEPETETSFATVLLNSTASALAVPPIPKYFLLVLPFSLHCTNT